jgi:hypothetical protein
MKYNMKHLPVVHMQVLYFIVQLDLEKYLLKTIRSHFSEEGSFEWFCPKISMDL